MVKRVDDRTVSLVCTPCLPSSLSHILPTKCHSSSCVPLHRGGEANPSTQVVGALTKRQLLPVLYISSSVNSAPWCRPSTFHHHVDHPFHQAAPQVCRLGWRWSAPETTSDPAGLCCLSAQKGSSCSLRFDIAYISHFIHTDTTPCAYSTYRSDALTTTIARVNSRHPRPPYDLFTHHRQQ